MMFPAALKTGRMVRPFAAFEPKSREKNNVAVTWFEAMMSILGTAEVF